MFKKVAALLIISLALLLLVACDDAGPGLAADTGAFDVDPRFKEFYNYMGGQEILGEVISSARQEGAYLVQYTNAAQMVYDPEAPASRRFYLMPLGLELAVAEPPVSPPAQPGLYYVDGHIIFPDFLSLYNRLGGARFTGRPLTEMHYNPEKKRYEQYFENVGFYRLENEPQENVHLLAYGAWSCNLDCRRSAPANSIIMVHPEIAPIFADTINRLGSDFTGFALTEAYPNTEGNLEQVFENIVLAADKDTNQVSLRHLPDDLGMLHGPLVEAIDQKIFFFYSVQGELGYNVPQLFLDYLARHGGLEVSGPPVTELTQVQSSVYQQCFSNLCLNYDNSQVESIQLRPAPLGFSYKNKFYHPKAETDLKPSGGGAVQREVSLQVSEMSATVASSQAEEVGVTLYENGAPLPGVQPFLDVTLPDGSQQRFDFPPTAIDGQTLVRVPAIAAMNGTLIPYKVCVPSSSADVFCVRDSYLIWNNP